MPLSEERKKTRQIHGGDIPIGGNAPIAVQSMTNTDTRDVSATVHQIEQLSDAGCEIVRLAIPDEDAVTALREIKKKVRTPLIADIHFDHRLALGALSAGADGLRINPGNIGSKRAVEKVVNAARDVDAPIRIGVNAGSLHKQILSSYGGPTPEAMVASAMEHVRLLESLGFDLIKISLKSSNVINTIKAYELLS